MTRRYRWGVSRGSELEVVDAPAPTPGSPARDVGRPVSDRRPEGAAVVVFRRGRGQVEYLLLHRASWGRAFDGDWAWGSPGGHRDVGEDPLACAERELFEETGLALTCRPVRVGDGRIAYFVAEAPVRAQVTLSDEHDALRWADRESVIGSCLPRWVAEDFARIAACVETSIAPVTPAE